MDRQGQFNKDNGPKWLKMILEERYTSTLVKDMDKQTLVLCQLLSNKGFIVTHIKLRSHMWITRDQGSHVYMGWFTL